MNNDVQGTDNENEKENEKKMRFYWFRIDDFLWSFVGAFLLVSKESYVLLLDFNEYDST